MTGRVFGCVALHVDPDGAASPLACVAGMGGTGGASAGGGAGLLQMIASADLRDAVLLVDLEHRDPRPWLAFAGVFACARQAFDGRAAGLAILTDATTPTLHGCLALHDDGVVDALDGLLALREASGWLANLLAQAAAAVVVESYRGDVDLIEEMATLTPEAAAFDPFAWFAARADGADVRRLYWRGRGEACPCWLSRHHPERLRHRIWRGQVSVLLPWLEELRTDYLELARATLGRGAADALTGEPLEIAAYEFPHIVWALRQAGAAKRRLDAVDLLRRVRNELAHGRPISVEIQQRMEAAARALCATG